MELFEWTGMNWQTSFSLVTLLILVLVAIYSAAIPQGGRRFWVFGAMIGALVLLAQWLDGALWRMLLLDAAALAAVALVWQQNRRAGRLYLAAVVAGGLLTAGGLALGGFFSTGPLQPQGAVGKICLALLVLGFSIKLAVIPFSFWLPPVAESASPMSAVLIIAVLDMAELGELALLRVEAPWVFTAIEPVWIGLALLTMFAGALLALSQTNVRRMLAFSTIDDMGYLLLGLAAGTPEAVLGVLIGAVSHAACKFLLFGAVGAAENDLKHPLTLADRGLATQYPLAGAAFIAGSLGMIGVPPLMGFLGRWRLYLSGVTLGGAALGLAMAAATGLALFYYVRVIHRVWLGAAETTETRGVPRPVGFCLAAVMVLLVAAGLFPMLLPGLGGR